MSRHTQKRVIKVKNENDFIKHNLRKLQKFLHKVCVSEDIVGLSKLVRSVSKVGCRVKVHGPKFLLQ